MIVPVASFVFYFSHDLLLLWTQSIEVAQNAAFPLSLLALAYCFNSMMQLPWRLQLAYGITRIMLIFNSAAVIILFPIMFFLIRSYGIQGAGIGWVVFNLGYYLIIPHWMHKSILPTHKWRWYFYDTFLFIVIGWFLFGIAFVVQYVWHLIGLTLLVLLLAGIAYIIFCYFLYPAIRYSIQDLAVTFSKHLKSLFSRLTSVKLDQGKFKK
jgi:O-antigen/teichoic acid export membrane protein